MSSSASPFITASSSRATLSLPAPPSGAYHPGETLRPTLDLHGSSEYTEIHLRVKAWTKCTIMGKDRWQAGQMSNIGFGGAATLITSLEKRVFLEQDIPLQQSADIEKKHSSSGHPVAGTYDFVLPAPPPSELVPSCIQDQSPDCFDPAGVSVTWSLEFLGVRHGFLKRNDTLKVDIPVAMLYLPPADPAHWPSQTTSHELKFKGNDGALSLDGTIAVEPLTRAGQPVHISFTLSSPQPETRALLAHTSNLTVQGYLARHVRTTPVVDPNAGKEMRWAGYRIGGQGMLQQQKGSDLVWVGEVEVPPQYRTVDSPGVAVNFSASVQLFAPDLLTSRPVFSIPIFLPSSTLGGSDNAQGSEAPLPAYQA